MVQPSPLIRVSNSGRPRNTKSRSTRTAAVLTAGRAWGIHPMVSIGTFTTTSPGNGAGGRHKQPDTLEPAYQTLPSALPQDFEGVGNRRIPRRAHHGTFRGNDLLNHPTAWNTLTKFVLDDPDKSLIPGTETPVYQIHTFPMWFYEGVWFGLTDILAATNKHVTEGDQDYHTSHERGVWEFYMAPSRDAVNYDFSQAAYPRKPLIPRGPAGSFDKDCVRPPSNIVTHNDEHWIILSGDE